MKKFITIFLSLCLILLLFINMSCEKKEKPVEALRSAEKVATQENIGEELFNKHCIRCHREGNNIENINKPVDVVKAMRHPKSGMPKFEVKEIPDKEANVLASFIFLSIISKK